MQTSSKIHPRVHMTMNFNSLRLEHFHTSDPIVTSNISIVFFGTTLLIRYLIFYVFHSPDECRCVRNYVVAKYLKNYIIYIYIYIYLPALSANNGRFLLHYSSYFSRDASVNTHGNRNVYIGNKKSCLRFHKRQQQSH